MGSASTVLSGVDRLLGLNPSSCPSAVLCGAGEPVQQPRPIQGKRLLQQKPVAAHMECTHRHRGGEGTLTGKGGPPSRWICQRPEWREGKSHVLAPSRGLPSTGGKSTAGLVGARRIQSQVARAAVTAHLFLNVISSCLSDIQSLWSFKPPSASLAVGTPVWRGPRRIDTWTASSCPESMEAHSLTAWSYPTFTLDSHEISEMCFKKRHI